jgi:hypothetical protein
MDALRYLVMEADRPTTYAVTLPEERRGEDGASSWAAVF